MQLPTCSKSTPALHAISPLFRRTWHTLRCKAAKQVCHGWWLHRYRTVLTSVTSALFGCLSWFPGRCLGFINPLQHLHSTCHIIFYFARTLIACTRTDTLLAGFLAGSWQLTEEL
jgi:hypothetical protein